jgi:branched-chain amino acid transport system permease protein
MKRLRPILLWCLWLALISAPFVWVRIDHDRARQMTVAKFHTARLQFVLFELPRWLLEQIVAVLAILLSIAALAWALTRWQRPRWTAWRATLAARFADRQSSLLKFGLPALLALVLAGPPLVLSDKYLHMAAFAGLYVVLALGLNITVGMLGLLVLGYAAFFAVGAYTFAILQRDLGMPFWMAFVPAAVAGAGFGFLLGLPTLRLRGDYLAIVTLGFGETMRYLLKNLSGLTGGDFGIIIRAEARALPFGVASLSDVRAGYVVIVLLAIVTIFALHRIHHSRIGRAWIAIREDETAAAAMGIDTVRLKILAFTLSAVWAALAGVFYAGYVGFVDPESFRFEESVLILSMVVLGGMGSVPGVIVGAVALHVVPTLLRDQFPALMDYRLLIFGATMVAMMVFRPQGLIGSLRRKIELKADRP